MDVVIPTTVIVLGCGLVLFGTVLRLGVAKRLSPLDLDAELATKVSRGGVPLAVSGLLSVGIGVIQWSDPLPTVGWLTYTLGMIALLFLGAARIGGA
jgi:hypothetical protein